jgi:hypothetical protein
MQSITFAADFGSLLNKYKVIEMSEELLQEIENGNGEYVNFLFLFDFYFMN